jgi:hypothetical protein
LVFLSITFDLLRQNDARRSRAEVPCRQIADSGQRGLGVGSGFGGFGLGIFEIFQSRLGATNTAIEHARPLAQLFDFDVDIGKADGDGVDIGVARFGQKRGCSAEWVELFVAADDALLETAKFVGRAFGAFEGYEGVDAGGALHLVEFDEGGGVSLALQLELVSGVFELSIELPARGECASAAMVTVDELGRDSIGRAPGEIGRVLARQAFHVGGERRGFSFQGGGAPPREIGPIAMMRCLLQELDGGCCLLGRGILTKAERLHRREPGLGEQSFGCVVLFVAGRQGGQLFVLFGDLAIELSPLEGRIFDGCRNFAGAIDELGETSRPRRGFAARK